MKGREGGRERGSVGCWEEGYGGIKGCEEKGRKLDIIGRVE